jgi:hypothetical protein
MAFILIALLAIFLTVGGADRASAYLMPWLDPAVGAWVVIAGLGLIVGLLLPPTRLLVSAGLLYSVRGLCFAVGAIAQGILYAARMLWQTVHSTWRSLRRGAV